MEERRERVLTPSGIRACHTTCVCRDVRQRSVAGRDEFPRLYSEAAGRRPDDAVDHVQRARSQRVLRQPHGHRAAVCRNPHGHIQRRLGSCRIRRSATCGRPHRRRKFLKIKSNMTLIMVDKPQPSYNLLNVMK